MDILILKERIKNTILLGESQFREFKSAYAGEITKTNRGFKEIAEDISKTLVAFANADGGELLIGVEDDGVITGCDLGAKTVDKLLQVPKTHIHQDTPLQNYKALQIEIDSKEILYFSIEKSLNIHQTSDGKCLQRRDLESIPVSFKQLHIERTEQVSREYDRQYVFGANVTDLDIPLLKHVGEVIAKGMSVEKVLQYLDLADYKDSTLILRRAALLLFGNDIIKWHPRSEVRILRIRGTELYTGRDYNVKNDEKSYGNIIKLMTTGWESLRPHLVDTKFHADGLFRERIMYPEDACREALTNAIAHRDYSNEGRGIEILIFDDRMEIISPGGLLSTINIKDIKSLTGVHQSRNTKIARVLKEIGYMREMGEGMRRIFSLMEQNDLLSPVLKSDSSEFNITLSHKSVYSEEDQRIIQGYNLFKLTREEMFIVLLGKDNKVISPKQIYDNLKLSDWDVYREIVSNLQFKGILKNTLNGIQKKKLARNKNLSQRDIPRIAVRTPSECEDSLTELFETISKLGSFNIISQAYLDECKKALKTENIFKDKSANLYYLFKLIDLIDEEKKPKAQLNEIWKKNNSGIYKKSIKPSMLSDKKTAKNDIPITTKPKSIEAKNQPPIPSTSAIIPKDIFIENLEYHVTSDELKLLFDKYGEVIKVSIPKDFYTGLGRGFGFVIMQNYQEAIDAIHDLNNTNYKGRIIRVNFSTKNQ